MKRTLYTFYSMMKKSFLFTAAASVLCLASCSQDDFAPVQDNNENGNVTFTVSLNDKPATRAFGDGLSAKNLAYAVYDVSDTEPILAGEGRTEFSANSLSTTLNITLANGRDYRIAFFASNQNEEGNNVYSFDAQNKKITVDYSKTHLTADQNVDQDCFFNVLQVNKDQIGSSLSVTLNRPVAQINFGTADLGEDAVKAAYGENGANLRTTLTTTAYTTLNLLDGSVDLDSEEEFTTTTPAKIIAEVDGIFPVDGYDYVHCAYVLVPKTEKSVAEVILSITGGTAVPQTVEVSNVPLQANYRTNIYGNLLTSTTDITVDKDADWSDPDYNIPIWDGSVANALPETIDGVMELSTPAQFAKLAQEVNNGNKFQGVTVKLAADINLNNINWTPIGTNNKPFEGSFDGQGYTIYNLSIIQYNNAAYAGFFGNVNESADGLKNVKIDGINIDVRKADGATDVGGLAGHVFRSPIANISVKKVNIQSYRRTGGVVGYIYGNLDDCYAENVTIDIMLDPTNDNGDKAGAIAGYCAEAGSGVYTTKNNSAKNVSISGFRDLGGLFGMMQYTRSMENNTATDVTITVNAERNDLTSDKPENFGAIVGRWGKSGNSIAIVGENNSFLNYTFVDKDGNKIENQSGILTQEDAK